MSASKLAASLQPAEQARSIRPQVQVSWVFHAADGGLSAGQPG